MVTPLPLADQTVPPFPPSSPVSPPVRSLGAQTMGDEWGTIMVIAYLRLSSVPALSGATPPGRKNPLRQCLRERVMYAKGTVANRPRDRLTDIHGSISAKK